MMKERMSIGEFSRAAGVSPRTLRFYEEKGLLMPSYISESGRRYYRPDDLIPLQQIISYKYLGFSLNDIKALISGQTGNSSTLLQSLQMQKQALEHKQQHIKQILKAIDHAAAILEAEQTIEPQVFSFLIHSIVNEKQQMELLSDWFPEPLVQRIKDTFADEKNELEWNMQSTILFQNIKEAFRTHRPDADKVQALIEQLFNLISELFGDNWHSMYEYTDILENMELPDSLGTPFTDEEEQLFAEAIDHYLIKKGLLTDEHNELNNYDEHDKYDEHE